MHQFGLAAAGLAAGLVTGLFGGGGGMVLIPLLARCTDIPQEQVFPASLRVILSVCLICLMLQAGSGLPWGPALPWLLGSALGGTGAGLWGGRIPAKWLHRLLGVLILWGGIRYLW